MRALPLNIRRAETAQLRAAPLAIPAALGLLAVLARLPFVRETPANWDSVQFVLALSHFDLHYHQPHPPGYILYIFVGRALNALVGDPSLALSYLSVAASALAVPLLYRLALRIFEDEGVALGSALFLLASPLALYYGAVPLVYISELALTLVVAASAWTVRTLLPAGGPALLMGIALGVAGGVRQSTLLVLLPLCAWALWGSNLRRWLLFGGALVATCALWLIPLLVMSGGIEAYLQENALLAERVSSRTSLLGAGPGGVAENLALEMLAIGTGLAFALVPLGLWVLRVARFSLSPKVKSFFLWWSVPPLAFFATSHIGQHGYVLLALPPLFMLAALCSRVFVEKKARWFSEGAGPDAHQGQRSTLPLENKGGHRNPSLLAVALCALLALASAAYFVLAQSPTTGPSIARNDLHWKAVSAALSGAAPTDTVLVADTRWDRSFRLAGYLLPEFRTYGAGESRTEPLGWRYSAYGGRSNYALPWPPAQLRIEVPTNTRNVVFLDEELAAKVTPPESLRPVALADGSSLYFLTASNELHSLVISRGTISAVEFPVPSPKSRVQR